MLGSITLFLATFLFIPSISGAVPQGTRVSLQPAAAISGAFQLAQHWDDVSPDDREGALRNYRRYQELPAERREDVDKHYEKWKNLPKADRDRYRRKYEDYRGRGLLND